MDPKSIGNSIAKFRKKCGLSQFELAEKLQISNKTVSRWESGLGYPEVTQFPKLAEIFGVTVDYLMSGERKGITVAGNILTDIVKNVNHYPQIGMLSDIEDMTRAIGGCVPNTAINLAKIDRNIPITAIGKIGDDEHGNYVLSQLKKHNINCDGVKFSADKPTGFSDVISLPSGERTFFHARGANSEFAIDDIDISSLNSVILHIGQILLLDNFDKPDPKYGTVMARFLHNVQEAGIKTSVKIVSDSTMDYTTTVLPALSFCDYIVIKEKQIANLTELKSRRTDGSLDRENIKSVAEFIAFNGVKEKVIIQCKETAFCFDVPTGKFTAVNSLNIPKGEIKGGVGSGDAFCAGVLYGLYNRFDDKRLLEFATATAACNLFSENSVNGMRSKNEIYQLEEKYSRNIF